MRHSMDFDDTCYFVDVVDDLVSYFVQDTFFKDDLDELLGPSPVEDEELVEELQPVKVAAIQVDKPSPSPLKRLSRIARRWRKSWVKENKSPKPPKALAPIAPVRTHVFGEHDLINSLIPYSFCGCFAGGHVKPKGSCCT